MSACRSEQTRRRYGIERVCRVWNVARSTFYGRRGDGNRSAPRVPTKNPSGWLSETELLAQIRAQITATSEDDGFLGEGYRKVWARLRARGVRTSKRRVLRLMRENGLLAPTRKGRPPGPRTHDGTIITDAPDVMWGTDATAIWTRKQGMVTVFFVVDHCTTELLGVHAAKWANRFEALEPIKQAVRHAYGGYDQDIAKGLKLRHDHGSQFVSRDYQNQLKFLGIESSPSFVRNPQGNGVAERYVRTLKEQLLWQRDFEDAEDVRVALMQFKTRYNERWILGRHGYASPQAVRKQLSTAAPVAA